MSRDPIAQIQETLIHGRPLKGTTMHNRVLPTLKNYETAYQHWLSATPFKKEGEDTPRPLGTNRRRTMTIRREVTDICCKYHDTDCVIFHANDDITLDWKYPSQSTRAFIEGIVPGDICKINSTQVLWLRSPSGNLWHAARGYNFENKVARITKQPADGLWYPSPSTPADPWRKFTVDRKVSRKVYAETGYADFKIWVKAYKGMGGEMKTGEYGHMSEQEILASLKDRSQWTAILASMTRDRRDGFGYRRHSWGNRNKDAETTMDFRELEHLIHKTFNCIKVEELPLVTGYREWNSMIGGNARNWYSGVDK